MCSNEGPCPFQGGDNFEIAKILWRNLKIFFSWPTGLISTKLQTKHPGVKGTQVCSNEGLCPFQRGDNFEIAKILWRNLKNLLGSLAKSIPGWRGFKFVQMDRPHLFTMEDN